MPNSTYVKVRDKKTGIEREITKKAYSILPKRYQLLGDVESPNSKTSAPNGKRVAQPAGAEVKRPQTEEEIQAKRDELNAMNQAAIDKAEAKSEEGIKVRRKPGPKPKTV